MRGKKLFFFYILLFILSLLVFGLLFDQKKISQDVLDLFPKNEDKIAIEAYKYFASSKYIPIAIEGFSKETQDKVEAIKKRLLDMPYIVSVVEHDIPHNYRIYDFLIHNNKYLLAPLELQEAASTFAENIFAPLIASFANSDVTLSPLYAKGYGLMLLAEIQSLEDDVLKTTLEDFKNLKKDYPSIHYFSADFMRVENLNLILQEVNLLLIFSSLFFIVLYFVILRIPLLTLSTIITLVFSNTLAILLTLYIYPKVTIMAISFGMGISNIAIDYMLHHHFFGLYTHPKDSSPPALNRSVFYGYFTTMIGFGACLFIPFPLLAQLSLYAMISLSTSYIIFALIYPRIGFKPPKLFHTISILRKPCIPNIVFILLTCLGFIFALNVLKLDFDLSKLDYQNKSMLKEKMFFETFKNENEKFALISAKDFQGLVLFMRGAIQHLQNLDFQSNGGNSNLKDFYYLASMSESQLNKMLSLLEKIKHNQPLPNLWNTQEIELINQSHISIDGRTFLEIMDNLASTLSMVTILLIALFLMLISLAINVKKAFIDAVNFILFPLSMSLLVVSIHSPLNMMHLFALLILVVVSVDFGIYRIKEGENPRTTHAIFFSALTTGIGFGILIISQTKALNSFGEVIFTGMSCILILLIFGKLRKDSL